MNVKRIIEWIPKIVVAFILLQTLLFKFGVGGDEFLAESQSLFSTLSSFAFGSSEYEAFLRLGTGFMELIASILILVPRTTLYGALLAIGLMFGAVLSHLAVLGVQVKNDGGQLFLMAIIVLVAALKIVYDNRTQLR